MTTETQCCTAGTVTAGQTHSATCKPDALTRLEAFVRENESQMMGSDAVRRILHDARQEMEALRERLSVAESVVRQLSGRGSEALRMGQQQGRVELAQEILENSAEMNGLSTPLRHMLESIISEDAGQ